MIIPKEMMGSESKGMIISKGIIISKEMIISKRTIIPMANIIGPLTHGPVGLWASPIEERESTLELGFHINQDSFMRKWIELELVIWITKMIDSYMH